MDVHAALDPAVLEVLATSCEDQDSPVPKDATMARASQEMEIVKEVWEAPMPGEWQLTEKSGVPSWDKTKLKEEENPPDWVEPPQPKVDLSLSPYKEKFDAEDPRPPVTPIENKEELLRADNIPEDQPVVVLLARGYVRTTRWGLKESKRRREQEEREVFEMLQERGFFGGRG